MAAPSHTHGSVSVGEVVEVGEEVSVDLPPHWSGRFVRVVLTVAELYDVDPASGEVDAARLTYAVLMLRGDAPQESQTTSVRGRSLAAYSTSVLLRAPDDATAPHRVLLRHSSLGGGSRRRCRLRLDSVESVL